MASPARPMRVYLPPINTTTTSNEWPIQSTLLPSLLDSTSSKPGLVSDHQTRSTIHSTPPWRPSSSHDLEENTVSRRNRLDALDSPSSSSTSPLLLTPPSTPLSLSRPTLTSPKSWTPDFSLNLLFTNDGVEKPPSFYPSARIFFSPQLRIQSSNGIPYSNLGGLHLGVTGLMEILDIKGKVKSSRVFCDFTTDVSAGLTIWKRDAEKAKKALGQLTGDSDDALPAGTYVLPLSMRIPRSDKLPPSFESNKFRISYTMSLALFSSASTSGNPRHLKVFSIPFHVLPSSLPSPPPTVPILTHTHRKGVFASIFSSLSSTSKSEGYHIVIPSIPTSSFSPGNNVPVSLRILKSEPTDIYVRISLIRRLYVRESVTRSLAVAAEDEWGMNGITPNTFGLPDEVLMERWNVEENEISSRWGFIPYSSRPDLEKSEVIIQDLALPLGGTTWTNGYSTSLDLEPTMLPTLLHGESSWFSPAFRTRLPVAKEYSKHVHISSKFFVSIEVGFSTPDCTLSETLTAIKSISPDISIPPPNSFTSPQSPSTSRYSGASLSNPFQPLPGSSRSRSSFTHLPPHLASSSTTTSPFNTPAFPGKFRQIFVPIEIGSVAEPSLDCISDDSATFRAEREGREERGEDTGADGEGSGGAWQIAPPSFDEAILQVPYVFSC